MNRISILGCGWLGMPLGAELVSRGYVVKGSSRSESKLSEIALLGMSPYLVDLEKEEHLPLDFFASDIFILNVPPSNAHSASAYADQMGVVLDVIMNKETKVLFVSSTGVYPDVNRVVTEKDADRSAISRSGVSLLEVEEKFQSEKNTIVRFGGLIDARRHPGRWFAGKVDLDAGNAPVNLVHLEDCIGAICAIIEQGAWGEVFNVCYPEHPSKSTYYPQMSLELGLEAPTYAPSGLKEWKVVSPEKFLRKTGYIFRRSIWDV